MNESSVPDPIAPTGSPRRLRGLARLVASLLFRLVASVCSLFALIVFVVLGVWALAHTEWLSERALTRLPGVTVTAPQGALLGDFQADRVEVALPRGGSLVLVSPSWQRLRLQADFAAPWWLGVAADRLTVRRLVWRWVPDAERAPRSPAPTDLSLPVSLTVDQVRIDEAVGLSGSQPLAGLKASVRAGPQRHEVRLQSLSWSGWNLAGVVGVGARAPMPLELDLRANAAVPKSGRGELVLRARGPLSDVAVDGQGRWQPDGGAAQTVEVQSRLDVLAPWPVRQARVRASELDLAAFSGALPRTQLVGTLELAPKGASALTARVELDNPMAAPWDAGRLPVRSARGTLTLERGQALKGLVDVLQAGRVDLVLVVPGDAPAGKGSRWGNLRLQGPWGGDAPLVLQVQGLEPRGLHGAAPALRLDGEVTVKPSPWVAQGKQVDPSTWQAELRARLRGLIARPGTATGAAGEVALSLDSRLSAQAWRVTEWTLTSGAAQARLEQAWVTWGQPGAGWSAAGRLAIQRFDPRVWFPWPAAMGGHNSLSGQGRFELDSRLRGAVDWHMDDSQLAGLPLGVSLQWRSSDAKAMVLKAQADVAGNRLQVDASGPLAKGSAWVPFGEPTSSAANWELQADAPRLQALSPLAPLMGLRQLGGSAQLQGRSQGGRPFSGRLNAQSLSWQPLAGAPGEIESVKGEWLFDPRASEAPLRLQLAARGVSASRVRIDQALVDVDGSVLAHRLRLQASGAWVRESNPGGEAGDSASANEPLRLDLALTGGWTAAKPSGAALTTHGTWRARLSEASLLAVGSVQRPPLLRVQPVELTLDRGPRGLSLNVQPTRLVLLGADLDLARLRWSAASAQDPQGELDVLARLQPLGVAPLLARWQPQAGWGGDLTVGGQVRLLSVRGRPWEADVELARQSGDLSLTDSAIEGGGALRLGLRDASLSVRARDGVWVAQQKLDGRVFGQLVGRQQVQATSSSELPGLDSALQGELSLQVSNLRPLATWAPPGWRLSGQMQAAVRLAGTLGEPKLTGSAQGRQLGVSHALLGLHVSDGELDMALVGDKVRLQRLEARGGAQGGSISAQGELTLGTPSTLTLDARTDRFAALQRVDRRVVISGAVQVRAMQREAGVAAQVRGGIRVDEGLIDISRSAAPTLGSDVTVIRRPLKGTRVADAAGASGAVPGLSSVQRPPTRGGRGGAAESELDIHIGVDLGDRLRLKGHGLDGVLVGKLNVTTPSNRPAVHGVIEVDKGTFAAYGQKLIIQRSTVTFTGLIDNPRLDILAMRPQSPAAQDSDVKVGVRITGTAQDPRVRLYSEPALSETEQLSWLVLGRGPTGLGGADIGLLQSAAVALLSGEDSRGPSDQLIGLLGLDELSVRQTDGAVRDTVVNVGKQVSRLWYVGYERNLNATGGNWQLIYTLARRFRLRAQAGEDNAVDLIWQWRWD